jgi:hypothetical protein
MCACLTEPSEDVHVASQVFIKLYPKPFLFSHSLLMLGESISKNFDKESTI